jgi:chitodextrinase
MKQVNFSHSGGFPLEQETLERLQTAYRTELFGALKSHLGINPDNDYIVAPATSKKVGWAIIRQDGEGILYPIQIGTPTNFLKTTRTGTNLIYGTGTSQTAYYDYEAKYISETDYANRPATPITDALAIRYYDLKNPAFIVIKDIKTIEAIIDAIEVNIDKIEADINLINQTYLPLDGSKAMKGDLNLDIYQLSKLDIKESSVANVRVADFRLGSTSRRGLLKPSDSTGRALVDSSDQTTTSLSLNYQSDWENTYVGGKVFLNNINTSDATGSLLVVDNANQVTKSNTLIDSLLNRITALENKPATAVPIGMIAIWGKPAPFPEGWEEHVPLRGRVPVGLDISQWEFNTMGEIGGSKTKTLEISEMPNHGHDWKYSYERDDDNRGSSHNEFTFAPGKILVSDELNPIGKTGGGLPFSIMNPYKVVHFIEYTGNITEPTDSIAPTTPTSLKVTNIGTTSVTLSWNASTDNVAVTNYLVYRNGTLIDTLGNVPTYNVSGLTAGTTYNFYVIAKDATGNLSGKSNVESATTTEIVTSTKPTLPTDIRARFTGVNRILIDWNIEPNNVGNVIYQILTGDSLFGNYVPRDKTTDNHYIDTNVSKYNNYYYKLRIINEAGDPLSDFSQVIEAKAAPEMEDE